MRDTTLVEPSDSGCLLNKEVEEFVQLWGMTFVLYVTLATFKEEDGVVVSISNPIVFKVPSSVSYMILDAKKIGDSSSGKELAAEKSVPVLASACETSASTHDEEIDASRFKPKHMESLKKLFRLSRSETLEILDRYNGNFVHAVAYFNVMRKINRFKKSLPAKMSFTA